MGVRLYSSNLGRFVSVDPVAGGSANDYDYAYANPLNIHDLDGRCPWFIAALAAKLGYKAYKASRAAKAARATTATRSRTIYPPPRINPRANAAI